MQKNEFTEKLKETSHVPERISPENIEKKIEAANRSKITLRKRIISAAAALAIVAGGTAGYLYNSGYFDKKNSPIKTSSSSSSSSAVDSNDDDSQTGTIKTTDTGTQYQDTKSIELVGLKSLSYDELNDFLKDNLDGRKYYDRDKVEEEADMAAETNDAVSGDMKGSIDSDATAAADDRAAVGDNSNDESHDFSDTYTQEAGIDEADIIKTNGSDIFYLAKGSVFAIDCDNGNMDEQLIDFKKLFNNDFKNASAREMYLDGGKLTIVLQTSNPYRYRYWIDEDMNDVAERDSYQPTVNVITLDVSDTKDIKPTGKYTIQGNYQESRMKDGKLYLSATSGINYYDTYTKTGVPEFAPVYTINGEEHYVSSGDIFVPTDDSENIYGCTTLSLIDTDSACRPESIKSVIGLYDKIYQTDDRLVLAGTYYDYTDEDYRSRARIAMFDTTGCTLAPLASTTLIGNIKDRYSINYRNDVLSVVVNESYYDERKYEMKYNNYLYTFNNKLEQLGQSENFGEGEVVKSVTFKDGYAYIVTFMQTDPLFAIDLADPKDPKIVSELKMPGFSTHMRAFTEGRIIGFGNTADEYTGRTTGLKLSIYDNSDPNNVKELDKVEIKEIFGEDFDHYIGSNATYDEKALLIDAEKNIIAFPYYAEKYAYEYNYDEDSVTYDPIKLTEWKWASGYKFYSYTEGKGFELLGEYKYETDLNKYYDDNSDNRKGKDPCRNYMRAIYIDDVYYLFYDSGVVSLNSKTFETIDEADLSELIPEPEYDNYYYNNGLIVEDDVILE